MLSNIEPLDDLKTKARLKSRKYETKTVKTALLEEALNQGWVIIQKNEKSVRLKKEKQKNIEFTDRIWSMLFNMEFRYLNNGESAAFATDPKDSNSQSATIEVVGIDDEVGIFIKCISMDKRAIYPQFREELNQYILMRQRLAHITNHQFAQPFDRQVKRQVGLIIFTQNIILSEDDKKRAKEGNVILFDENDLLYYEELISHVGPATKYQFLADTMPGKNIPGLSMRVPAIKAKMGGYICYTFSISPEYLLKISFVSHHAKGRGGSDIESYQRMLQKSRLKKIRNYIDEDGIFPTNIVINFDKKPNFDKREQETEIDSGVMGWLDIRSAYKSAWIIDGQHRLYAYSGHPKAAKAKLSILAFEALPAGVQSQLFVDINAEQKSVNQSLLQELYADLLKDAAEPEVRIRSTISYTIFYLDSDMSSPFYQRIQNSDAKKDTQKCISVNSMFRSLDSDLYIVSSKRNEYGPLWSEEGSEAIQRRTVSVLNKWFGLIKFAVPEWWDAGSETISGGLAMNDSVAACINILRSVFTHLSVSEGSLISLSDQDLSQRLEPYGTALGNYFNSLNEDQKQYYRSLRGGQGQTTRTRLCQQAIHEAIPDFNPSGLEQFMIEQKAQTNSKAKRIVDQIENALQSTLIDELKREYGVDESQWWMEGISKQIRIKVSQRQEEDDGKRGGKEHYFDLIDYRTIIMQNWSLFGNLFGYGKSNTSKEKRTLWINAINEIRRIIAHSSSGRSVTVEQLSELETYDTWLRKNLTKTNNDESFETYLQVDAEN